MLLCLYFLFQYSFIYKSFYNITEILMLFFHTKLQLRSTKEEVELSRMIYIYILALFHLEYICTCSLDRVMTLMEKNKALQLVSESETTKSVPTLLTNIIFYF